MFVGVSLKILALKKRKAFEHTWTSINKNNCTASNENFSHKAGNWIGYKSTGDRILSILFPITKRGCSEQRLCVFILIWSWMMNVVSIICFLLVYYFLLLWCIEFWRSLFSDFKNADENVVSFTTLDVFIEVVFWMSCKYFYGCYIN